MQAATVGNQQGVGGRIPTNSDIVVISSCGDDDISAVLCREVGSIEGGRVVIDEGYSDQGFSLVEQSLLDFERALAYLQLDFGEGVKTGIEGTDMVEDVNHATAVEQSLELVKINFAVAIWILQVESEVGEDAAFEAYASGDFADAEISFNATQNPGNDFPYQVEFGDIG